MVPWNMEGRQSVREPNIASASATERMHGSHPTHASWRHDLVALRREYTRRRNVEIKTNEIGV